MTTSEIIRLVAAGVLTLVFILWRLGVKSWILEGKDKKQKAEAKRRLMEERRQAREKAVQERDTRRRRTSQLLSANLDNKLVQKSVRAAGQEMWYLEGGVLKRGPTALLLHGFASDKEDWNDFAGLLLNAGYHVLAPDLPGFGQNERHPEKNYDIPTQAKRIRAFAQELGLDRFHLVGASLGGSIAAAYAYGGGADALLSLTLIEPLGVRSPQESELDQWLAQRRQPLMIATPEAYDNLLGFLYVTPPAVPEALKRHRAELLAKYREFYTLMWTTVRAGERAYLVDMLLPEIRTKTLVVQGQESKVVHPSTPEVITRRMPSATAVTIQGCGHFPAVERPQETASHVLVFLKTAGAAGA